MKLLRIIGEVQGDAYAELLRFLSLHAATFSLTMWHKATSSALDAIVRLKPYELEVREVSEWPGTRLLPGKTARLHRYRVGRDSIASLQQIATSLFSWRNFELPDDLCFYRSDGSVILETIASEDAAALHLRESELADLSNFPTIPVHREVSN